MVMKRRSPNYPGIHLEAAVHTLADLYQGHAGVRGVGRGQFTPQDAATAWKFTSTTGPVQIRLGALRQYGLLEGKKGENPRISSRGMTLILRDHGAREHRDALRDAGLNPTIFAELHQTMPRAASDALRQFLIVERNFTNDGANRLITVYLASLGYANLDESDNIAAQDVDNIDEEPPEMQLPTPPGSMIIPVPLAQDKIGSVTLPANMTKEDWKRFDRILLGYRPDEQVQAADGEGGVNGEAQEGDP